MLQVERNTVKQRKLLSQRHPILYFLAVWVRRLKRMAEWYLDGKHYATFRTTDKLSIRIKKHQSVLLKKCVHKIVIK